MTCQRSPARLGNPFLCWQRCSGGSPECRGPAYAAATVLTETAIALQLLPVPVPVPPGDLRRLLCDRALEPAGRGCLSRAGLAGVLRVVGCPLRAGAGRLRDLEFWRGPCDRASAPPGQGTGKPMGACRRGRRRSRRARLFQIRQFLHRDRQRRSRHDADATCRHPAARHFLLHLHPDRVPGRHGVCRGEGIQFHPLCAVRHLFPASDRRPDPASQGDDAAVRRDAEPSAERRKFRCWHRLFRHWSRQEMPDRRRLRA